jgi:hypothetical protein
MPSKFFGCHAPLVIYNEFPYFPGGEAAPERVARRPSLLIFFLGSHSPYKVNLWYLGDEKNHLGMKKNRLQNQKLPSDFGIFFFKKKLIFFLILYQYFSPPGPFLSELGIIP